MLGLKPPVKARADHRPRCPQHLLYLWRWFAELSPGLPVNGMAPPTVSWDVLAAWAQFMRLELKPWEASALVRLGELRAAILMENATVPAE